MKAESESLKTRLMRYAWNLFPAYFGTGARISYIAEDWMEMRVEVPLSVRTRNYVGTIFGGSMYGAVDPVYMLMLIRILGPGYIVWDKAAAIRFKRPGRTSLQAVFKLEPADIESIRAELRERPKTERVYSIELRDSSGALCAVVEKTLHISRKPVA